MAALLESTPTRSARPRTFRSAAWLRAYRQRSIATDVVVLVVAVLAAQVVRLDGDFEILVSTPGGAAEWLFATVLVGTWLVSLAVEAVWGRHVLGTGGPEYRRILVGSILPFAAVGVIGFLTQADLARGYLLISLPLGVCGLILGHRAWRHRLTVTAR